jgi:hypothetical protein
MLTLWAAMLGANRGREQDVRGLDVSVYEAFACAASFSIHAVASVQATTLTSLAVVGIGTRDDGTQRQAHPVRARIFTPAL